MLLLFGFPHTCRALGRGFARVALLLALVSAWSILAQEAPTTTTAPKETATPPAVKKTTVKKNVKRATPVLKRRTGSTTAIEPADIAALRAIGERCRGFEPHALSARYTTPLSEREEKELRALFLAFLTGPAEYPVFVDGRLRPGAAAVYQAYPDPVYPAWPSFLVSLYSQALAAGQGRQTDVITSFTLQFKEYGDLLASLDPADPATLKRAIDAARQRDAGRPALLRDAAYFQFRAYWEKVRQAQTVQLGRVEKDYRKAHGKLFSGEDRIIPDRDIEPLLEKFASDSARTANGFRLNGGEGGSFMDAVPGYFVDNFRGFVSGAVLDFLEQERDELEHESFVEGHLSVPPDTLAGRMVRMEQHLARYPQSPYAQWLSRKHDSFLQAYLGGTNTLSLIWRDDQTLEPEFRKSYEAFMRKYPATPAGRKVAAFYATLRRHGFAWSDALDKDLRAQGFAVTPKPAGRRRYEEHGD